MTELDAEMLLIGLLKADAVAVTRQFRLGGKIVDVMVAWPGEDSREDLETIEVKLHDWRRAVGQAYASGAYVGRASIAMPVSARRQVDEAYLRALGIGLIEFDADGWRRAIEPARNPVDDTVVAHLRAAMTGAA
jgi:hypothetical protein